MYYSKLVFKKQDKVISEKQLNKEAIQVWNSSVVGFEYESAHVAPDKNSLSWRAHIDQTVIDCGPNSGRVFWSDIIYEMLHNPMVACLFADRESEDEDNIDLHLPVIEGSSIKLDIETLSIMKKAIDRNLPYIRLYQYWSKQGYKLYIDK